MTCPVSPLIESVHFPPIAEVKGWLDGFRPKRPLIDLCQAVPDYAPAPELIEHLKGVVDLPQTARYSPDEGLPEVLEAVCARYVKRYGACINPRQVCLTVGASQAFWLAIVTLCRHGDEVVVQTPYYFDHPMVLQMLGITSVLAPFDPVRGGVPSPEEIERLITSKTRAILLVTPSNPTGVVTPLEVIHGLYQIAVRRNIALIIDETYADFIPDGSRPHDLFGPKDWEGNLVQIMSFGKTFALTGYRAGCLVAGESFIHHALKAQDTMAVCQPRITQHAILYGIEHLDDWVAANRAMMAGRHDLFCSLFRRPGNRFELVTSGAFFAWVRHPFTGTSGRSVARRLAREAELLVLPGEVFGPAFEGYLRLALGNIDEATIPEAVQRFRDFS